MNEPTISVVVFGKNNENIIGKMLESVKSFANEILYMDTGSTDKTLEIAKKYTDKIYYENMINRKNSDCRNFLNKEAKSKWTLFMDTDEVATKNFASEVKLFLKQIETMPQIHHVYFKLIDLVYDEKHMLSTPKFHPFLYHPRLALRDYAEWKGNRHETYIGTGEGVFWSIFAYVHYNLINVPRLRTKLLSDNGLFCKYNEEDDRNSTDEDVLKRFIGKSIIAEVPKEIIW